MVSVLSGTQVYNCFETIWPVLAISMSWPKSVDKVIIVIIFLLLLLFSPGNIPFISKTDSLKSWTILFLRENKSILKCLVMLKYCILRVLNYYYTDYDREMDKEQRIKRSFLISTWLLYIQGPGFCYGFQNQLTWVYA